MSKQQNGEGFVHWTTPEELADPENDLSRANNYAAKHLSLLETAEGAEGTASQALATANSYAGQIAQANTTAGQAVAIATDAKGTAEAIEGPISTRLGYLETREGLAPGDVYDVETASVLAQEDSESNAVLKAQIVVRERELFLNVKSDEFGATGNGVDDDTAAFQACIDYAGATGGTVFIPSGRFKVLSTLTLPPNFALQSYVRNKGWNFSTYQAGDSTVETSAATVFAPKPGVTGVHARINGGTFKAQGANMTLFGGGMEIKYSNINNLAAAYYHNVFDAQVTGVSHITNGQYTAIRNAFLAQGLTDSYVSHNYINAYSAAGYNATAFVLPGTSSHYGIHDNFVDFFKHGFLITHSAHQLGEIASNVIEYCFRGIDTGANSNILKTQIIGNKFNQLNKTAALSYFPSADTEMLEQPWTAINARRGMRAVTVTGNAFFDNERGIALQSYPTFAVRESANTWFNVPERVYYNPVHDTSQTESMKDIYFESMDNQRVTVKPTNYDPAAGSFRKYWDRQRLIFNGKPVWNDDGMWRDMAGAALA